MKPFLRLLFITVACFMFSERVHSQVTYELEIDSIIGIPNAIADGDSITFYLQVSISPLIYQGTIFIDLEYGGNFYRVDTTYTQNFLSPNAPNTIHATHRVSTENELSIGDNVVVVWPRIGDGESPPQTVVNPYTTTLTLVDPNGVDDGHEQRIVEPFLRPNPAINGVRFHIQGHVGISRSIIFDLSGKVLAESGRQQQMDISHLPAGIYFVNVTTEDGTVYSDKLLITR